MIHSTALVVLCLLAAGCYQTNSNFDPDAQACSGPSECESTEGKPICDDGVCVQCVDSSTCGGTTPICGDDKACRACTAHEQCIATSGVCLPSGACANASDVAFVAPSGMDGMCTKEMPCATLRQALNTGKSTVKIGVGLIKDTSSTLIEGRELAIVADRGAQIDRDGDGPILEIRGRSGSTTRVQIQDLELRGSSMGNAIDISASGGAPTVVLDRASINTNQGAGVVITGGGRLSVYRSRIHDNSGGGIVVTSQNLPVSFQIIGNFFYNNGTDTGTTGGVSISTPSSADNRLEFNSFHKNKAQDQKGTAIDCAAGTFTARNNILFANTTGSSTLQTSGGCVHAYSLVSPGNLPNGATNFAADPKFVSLNTVDLKISADSPAIGKADPSSDLTGNALLDLDGDQRKQPADIGADQLK